ncbi:MAG: phosphatidylserine decarboxylase family protein [Pseudomonadota bacterium]
MTLGLIILGIVAAVLSLFTIYFFRDPSRRSPFDKDAVLTPADGRILSIVDLKQDDNPLGKPALRVSVFMTIFDVHVNRVPMSGRVSNVTYRPGKFFSANLDKASEQNESNAVTLETHEGHKIVFVQIAGLIARRIACWVREGDEVVAGQRFGLIRFGSRLDIYLPDHTRIIARSGQKVRAGETIVGYLS